MRNPKFETAMKIADALGVNPGQVNPDFNDGQLCYMLNHPNDTFLREINEDRLDASQQKLLHDFSLLNKRGQRAALLHIEELTEIPKYQRKDNEPEEVSPTEPDTE